MASAKPSALSSLGTIASAASASGDPGAARGAGAGPAGAGAGGGPGGPGVGGFTNGLCLIVTTSAAARAAGLAVISAVSLTMRRVMGASGSTWLNPSTCPHSWPSVHADASLVTTAAGRPLGNLIGSASAREAQPAHDRCVEATK